MNKEESIKLSFLELENIIKGCNEAGLSGKYVNNIIIIPSENEGHSSIIIGADPLDDSPEKMPEITINIGVLEETG